MSDYWNRLFARAWDDTRAHWKGTVTTFAVGTFCFGLLWIGLSRGEDAMVAELGNQGAYLIGGAVCASLLLVANLFLAAQHLDAEKSTQIEDLVSQLASLSAGPSPSETLAEAARTLARDIETWVAEVRECEPMPSGNQDPIYASVASQRYFANCDTAGRLRFGQRLVSFADDMDALNLVDSARLASQMRLAGQGQTSVDGFHLISRHLYTTSDYLLGKITDDPVKPEAG